MVNLTLALSDSLRRRMEQHTDVKWSEIARRAFERKIEELELEQRILSKNKLTEKDVRVLAHTINREVFQEMHTT